MAELDSGSNVLVQVVPACGVVMRATAPGLPSPTAIQAEGDEHEMAVSKSAALGRQCRAGPRRATIRRGHDDATRAAIANRHAVRRRGARYVGKVGDTCRKPLAGPGGATGDLEVRATPTLMGPSMVSTLSKPTATQSEGMHETAVSSPLPYGTLWRVHVTPPSVVVRAIPVKVPL